MDVEHEAKRSQSFSSWLRGMDQRTNFSHFNSSSNMEDRSIRNLNFEEETLEDVDIVMIDALNSLSSERGDV